MNNPHESQGSDAVPNQAKAGGSNPQAGPQAIMGKDKTKPEPISPWALWRLKE